MPTPDAFSLDGRVAVVTGAASGIGAGIAALLAEAGARVVIADRQVEAARSQAEALGAAGHDAAAIELDLADEASIVAACAESCAAHGAPWLLVNNAGLQTRESLLDGTVAHWERQHAVNARGPFVMIRELARPMIAAGRGGRIVNIASASLRGSIIKGLVAYNASKAALLGLSGATAFELAEHGVTVNTVLPGAVMTPGSIGAGQGSVAAEGPARRALPLGMATPHDIAAAVLYFASPAAGRVTNQVIAVDGGFSVT